jgi:hypothetical protein
MPSGTSLAAPTLAKEFPKKVSRSETVTYLPTPLRAIIFSIEGEKRLGAAASIGARKMAGLRCDYPTKNQQGG